MSRPCADDDHVQLWCCQGAGMFIGTVVLGAVLGASRGATMRGALLRDVSSYMLAVALVAWIIGSGKVGAVVPDPQSASARLMHPCLRSCPMQAWRQHARAAAAETAVVRLQVTRGKALLLLGGYVVYVLAVCAADVTHRVRQRSQAPSEL